MSGGQEHAHPATVDEVEELMDSSSPNGLPSNNPPQLADIRAMILAAAGPVIADSGSAIEDVPDDLDLRASGMIDSLGFIELVTTIEDELGIELDFEGLDPEQITTLGPLARHVHAQMLAGRGETGEV
jgi:acyl carrier protein